VDSCYSAELRPFPEGEFQDEPLKYLSWFGLTVMLFLMILSVVPEIVSLLAD
jgi:hypothetical protein